MIQDELFEPKFDAPLAVSLGESAGIGPDLILQLYAQRSTETLPPFIVFGDIEFLRARAKRLGLDVMIDAAQPAEAKEIFEQALPVLDLGIRVADTPGVASNKSAELVIKSIEHAVASCFRGQCRALVTAPINKAAVKRIGFDFPGHTEFLAHLSTRNGILPTPIMMLAHEGLRVVPLTIHVALSRVPDMIKKSMIVEHIQIIAADLRMRFNINDPRIAVTGLNPHAGEEGAFGDEEFCEIAPAIAALKEDGLNVEGPFPADTAFHLPNWKRYDVVVAMYHDQALIPIKTVAFDSAVNVTLGLPLVRTSPDHGTAYDLAGTGKASASSMLAAIKLADLLSGTQT